MEVAKALQAADKGQALCRQPDKEQQALQMVQQSKKVLFIYARGAGTLMEIMVFVSNHGNIEIHTGPVHKILEIPGWINVTDPDFKLHLKTDDIRQCWVAEKPSEDGTVTSVEVFDANSEMIVQLFGKRKPGMPELEAWRQLVKEFVSL